MQHEGIARPVRLMAVVSLGHATRHNVKCIAVVELAGVLGKMAGQLGRPVDVRQHRQVQPHLEPECVAVFCCALLPPVPLIFAGIIFGMV